MRTKIEEPCYNCKQLTNFYDAMMGRVCPLCVAKICAGFGKTLAYLDSLRRFVPFDDKPEMCYLAEENKHLLTDPPIDHTNDLW